MNDAIAGMRKLHELARVLNGDKRDKLHIAIKDIAFPRRLGIAYDDTQPQGDYIF